MRFFGIINFKGYPNIISGSKVTAILLIEWILPACAFATERVCALTAKKACFFVTP